MTMPDPFSPELGKAASIAPLQTHPLLEWALEQNEDELSKLSDRLTYHHEPMGPRWDLWDMAKVDRALLPYWFHFHLLGASAPGEDDGPRLTEPMLVHLFNRVLDHKWRLSLDFELRNHGNEITDSMLSADPMLKLLLVAQSLESIMAVVTMAPADEAIRALT